MGWVDICFEHIAVDFNAHSPNSGGQVNQHVIHDSRDISCLRANRESV